MIKTFGASVIGLAHVNSGAPCHDAHYTKIIENDFGVIACVSDGMGSASHAEIGSQLISKYVVDTLHDMIEPSDEDEKIISKIKESYKKTHDALLEKSVELSLDIKDLNATCLVFLSIGNRQFYGQVGDCTMIGKKDDVYEVVAQQQRGEYANATFSICNLHSIEQGVFEKISDFYPQVALMSDGIESISISAKDQIVSHLFFDPFFKVFKHEVFEKEHLEASLIRFLASERIQKKTDDDKTLLFIDMGDV